jgi:hypothetical protein
MAIFYLQQLDIPVLPCLQEGATESLHNNYNIGFNDTYRGENAPCPDKSKNKQSLGDLLLGFFVYYAHVFDWKTDVVSVRMGRRYGITDWLKSYNDHPVTKQHVLSGGRRAYRPKCCCIEDPFELRNLTRTLTQDQYNVVRREIDLAVENLLAGRGLDSILVRKEHRREPLAPLRLNNISHNRSKSSGGRKPTLNDSSQAAPSRPSAIDLCDEH